MSTSRHDPELRAEQGYIAALYSRLDAEHRTAVKALGTALRDGSSRSTTARWERDVVVESLTARVQGLAAAGNGLCFGRLDRDGAPVYIGRIGLLDQDNDYEPLVTDWRAPLARPFYCATAANPDGVTRRRHFRTQDREVLDFHDELLDLSVIRADQAAGDAADAGADEALLAAVNAPRTETMRDIVATIQAEQDEIIRLPYAGVVVVDGGPGTGKTAVAMHRVAYLLYTQRERLFRRGVLVVGPHPDFLRYISDVLPSLGETSVVYATPGELLPGLRTVAPDAPETARVKGGLALVEVLVAAVADRQEIPETPIPIKLDDVTVELDHDVADAARERARATGLLHNQARAVFVSAVTSALTQLAVAQINTGWALGPAEAAKVAADVGVELAAHPGLAAALDRLWPVLTPQRLLADLFSSPARLATAAAVLPADDRAALYRMDGEAWTVSDVPLLDEAVELLGAAAEPEREDEEARNVEYARGVLQILDTDEDPDGELLRAVDVVGPHLLAERNVQRDHRELAVRAAEDREWTYGHVVLDEAQELSEMDWRVILRRCPSRSVTVVGDLAQRRSLAGARSWAGMLDRYVSDRWLYRELTTNYRTPAEVMELAAAVLATVDQTTRVPRSVRWTGERPWSALAGPGDLAAVLADAVRREVALVSPGSVAVIVPENAAPAEPAEPAELAKLAQLAELAELPGGLVPPGAPVTVLTPAAAKGLEFDAVIVVEPQRILAAEPRGAAALYVALTRATQRLGLVHTAPLPPVMAGLVAERQSGR